MNTAIIGYGKMGKIREEAISQDGRMNLKFIYEPNFDGELAEGVIAVNDADEIINDSSIDSVFVCTPNYRIVPIVIAALEAGKDVFSEKPPAFSAKEFQSVIEAEKKSGKKLMYGFNHRHHESIIKAKEVIESGELGKIIWMRGRYGKNVDASFFEGWRADYKLAGGGILLDQGIHMLDLFRNFAGDFDDVQAMISNDFWKKDIEDNVFAIMRNTDNGISASLHSTMTQWRHLFSLEIFLQKGHIVLNGLKTSSGMYGAEELSIAHNNPGGNHTEEEFLSYPVDKSWFSEVRHFVDCIEKDEEVIHGSSQDALKLMELVDSVYDSDKLYKRLV